MSLTLLKKSLQYFQRILKLLNFFIIFVRYSKIFWYSFLSENMKKLNSRVFCILKYIPLFKHDCYFVIYVICVSQNFHISILNLTRKFPKLLRNFQNIIMNFLFYLFPIRRDSVTSLSKTPNRYRMFSKKKCIFEGWNRFWTNVLKILIRRNSNKWCNSFFNNIGEFVSFMFLR